ncbi:MAG: hypothetical protein A2826_01370 [Candidatus Doudnabacteria bacterium RIFCSPHIGHO2_01_FULL_43_23]|uniref:Peptidase M50 domain-containing protein n=1 Tax=Candidatus Doudnabacteria bacterium RIFCSPHIGHO2_01_FULL_43_23 TaxID=1817822 RepID=A0A1F5NTA8_9BACT|nr:MAG: hypothetical protein A2826_01370 [Candidatus Doudnabacteria bacterium RIFCSPHIGHO2_01_FULL_43_23]
MSNEVIRRIFIFCFIGVVMVFLTLITHETGHVLMAKRYDGEILRVKLLGVEVYPEVKFSGFENNFGSVRYTGGSSYKEHGWIYLMGSGTNWLIAIGGLLVLFLFKIFRVKNFYLNTIFIFMSLMFLDFITYMFGWRLSGEKEPFTAAEYLGWNESIFFVCVMLSGALHLLAVIYLLVTSGYWRNFTAKQDYIN